MGLPLLGSPGRVDRAMEIKVDPKQVAITFLWVVNFIQYDLGYFDHQTCRLEPIENPFSVKVLPMSPV